MENLKIVLHIGPVPFFMMDISFETYMGCWGYFLLNRLDQPYWPIAVIFIFCQRFWVWHRLTWQWKQTKMKAINLNFSLILNLNLANLIFQLNLNGFKSSFFWMWENKPFRSLWRKFQFAYSFEGVIQLEVLNLTSR